MRTNETAQDIVNRCKSLFNLESPPAIITGPQSIEESITDSVVVNKDSSLKTSNCVYQLWLKAGKNEPLIPLIGNYYLILFFFNNIVLVSINIYILLYRNSFIIII